jgi:hypothetical protein
MTPDSVIDALGGTKAVAQALSLKLPTVSVWRTRGIPSGRWSALSRLASEKGVPEITLEALADIAGKPEEART